MFWDVIVATVASIVLGLLWFGPIFGKQWMKFMKISPKQMKAAKKKGMPASTWVLMIIGTLVTAVVLSVLVPATVGAAIKISAMLWLGFIAPVQLGMVLWEGKPWGLYLLTTCYYLVNLVIMGLIFAGFN